MANFTIYFEFDLLEQTLARVLSISDEVAGGGADGENISLKINILVGIFSVNSRDGVFNSRNGVGCGGLLARCVRSDVGGERWDDAYGGAGGGQGGVDDHVGEEITELGNAELHSSVELWGTGVSAHLVVFHADCGEWLEMAVNEENVSSFEVNQSWGRIRESLFGPKASNVFYTLVK